MKNDILSFLGWYKNQQDTLMEQKKATVKKAVKREAKQDTKGKLHEILVGYHLQGGRHMQQHADKDGDSPKQAHDKLRQKVSDDDYKKIYHKAKSAATDLKANVEKTGHKISHVHWTSKPGDIERSTGIKASQKEDASDIIIHSKKGSKTKYHGVSLKATEQKSKHVPISNPGMESTYGGNKIVETHRNEIRKKFPALAKTTNEKQRKALMNASPKMDSWVRSKNNETLQKLGKHLHNKLSSMSPSDLSHHIQTHVLQSHPTPLQKAGHEHIRHTSYMKRDSVVHHSYVPSKHFEHIFKDPRNISHHVKVEHGGGASVHFKYKGKTFASHTLKYNTQSDPLSSVKGKGTTSGD